VQTFFVKFKKSHKKFKNNVFAIVSSLPALLNCSNISRSAACVSAQIFLAPHSTAKIPEFLQSNTWVPEHQKWFSGKIFYPLHRNKLTQNRTPENL